MDKTKEAVSPIVGPTNNVSAKLKTGNFSDSPGSINCQSPHQNKGITNNCMSPYTTYNPDSKAEDVVLPKNGSSNCNRHTGQSPSPFFSNDTSTSDSCPSPSTTATINARQHSNTLSKRPFNNFGSVGSPNDVAAWSGGRTDRSAFLSSEQGSHGLLSRSLSANCNNKPAPNNMNPSLARRMASVDMLNPSKEVSNSAGGQLINSSKLPEKNSLHHSPLASGDFTSSDARKRNDNNSSFNLSTVSYSETVLGQNQLQMNPKNDLQLNHHISRTSSANSVSDLSPCSEITDENTSIKRHSNKNLVHTLNPTSSNPPFGNECNNDPNPQISELPIDNSLLNDFDDDILQTDNITLEGFAFSSDGNGSGANPPDLSAEEVRQALNSVSEESLNIGLTNTGSSNISSQSDLDVGLSAAVISESNINFAANSTSEKLDIKDILSSSTASSSHTTSSVTDLTRSGTPASNSLSSKLSPLSMDPMHVSLSNKNSSSVIATNPSSVVSSSLSCGSTKSHLQEILGAADTNRLKSMGRPVDANQYHSPSTSFTPTYNNQTKPDPYSTAVQSGNECHPMQQLSSPSGISPRHKFSPANSYQRNLHRQPNSSHPIPGASMQEYEVNQINHQISRSSYDQNKLMTGPHSVPASNNMPPYNMSPQAGPNTSITWQRQTSSSILPSHGLSGPLNEGNKSPRGPIYGNFPPRSINPMSGLQSTVDAIPSLNCLSKNNGNSMGPPNSCHRVPTPSEGCMSVSSSTMLPPQSPLTHDKRSVSADGSVTVSGNLKAKNNKRERGQSLDSKDGEKKEPKNKRRKSKSKDESKKGDSRAVGRCGADVQYYVFNTDLVNTAASKVMAHPELTIINHHTRCQGNNRLLPSKSSSQPSCPPKVERNSPRAAVSSSVTGNVKTYSHISTTTSNSIKTEGGNSHNKNETKVNSNPASVKAEPEILSEQQISASNQTEKEKSESLTDEQRKHRAEQLGRIEALRSQFLPEQNLPPNSASSWQGPNGPPRKQSDYSMSIRLQKVLESIKDNAAPDSEEWCRLVRAYNQEKRIRRQNHNVEDPPPYNSANPSSFPQRWMSPGHPIRESGAPDIPNSRFPHHGPSGPIRMPHDGSRFPTSHGAARLPRGYMVPPGANNRMHIYHGQPVSGGALPRGPIPRLPPSPLTNEPYPFSVKLKEQASIYQSEGPHSQGSAFGFDPNNPVDTMAGPRMGSPEWIQYGNSSNQRPMMLPSGGMPNQVDAGTSVDPSLDPSVAMQINNSNMGPLYNINSFGSKVSGTHSSYTSSMAGLPPLSKSFSNPVMRSDGIPMMHHDGGHPAGMMGDTITRRGETRPPDLNINHSLGRSGSPFHGGRHPMPSPGVNSSMMTSQFVPGDPGSHNQGSLPQLSPHPANISRSPIVNSPNIMKSPIGNQYVGIGQGGPMPSLDPGSVMQGGPRSAGPASAPPVDWNAPPTRAQSSGTMMVIGQKPPPIQQLIEGVSRFSNPLYRNDVKDSSSPPPLSHMMENHGMPPQEPPQLSHNPSVMEGNNMPVTPGSNPMMMRHPHPCVAPGGFESGPRSTGPRMMVPPAISDGYGVEFNRPPSHSEISMSPGPNSAGMMHPSMMDMHSQPGPYMSQSNMMPLSDNHGGPSHPGCPPGSNFQKIPRFDLSGILPSEKPSETLSYFPSGGGNLQESPQIEATSNMALSMRSPPMTHQSMNRFSSMPMNQRLPSVYHGNNTSVRMPGHGNFANPNPPGYPTPGNTDGYMPSSWEGVPRPQVMPAGVHNMHFQSNRPLI